MAPERARRTSSGSTLRLVSTGDAPPPAGTDPEPAPVPDDPPDASIVLAGERQSVGRGRHWVVQTMVDHGVTGMANQVVELLSSELLANAVLHGPDGDPIGVEIRCSPETARVSVTDRGGPSPVVLHREPAAAHGRGMAIVEAMSTRWGVEEHPDGGKTVWFELDLDEF